MTDDRRLLTSRRWLLHPSVAVRSQSEQFRAMPSVIMSTMNLTSPVGWHKMSATSVGYLSQQQENAKSRKIQSHDLDTL